MTILNTLAFEPTLNEQFNKTLTPADTRGQIFVTDGEITKGCEIVALIKSTPNESFLVSKIAFDHLVSLGYKNVCMFDPTKSTPLEKGQAQGGLLFS